MDLLPALDPDPDEWGPDHTEIEVTDSERRALIAEGNRQGREIDPDDDTDNGLTDE